MSASLDRLTAALADQYRIERELGAGGMATVYLARDLKHDREVAIKVLREDLSASLGSGRFLREIKIAAQLQHPHILPLLDSGEAGGFLFFVMPYIKGQSLRERIARDGELPVHDAVRLLLEVVDALVEAHAHGVVHRDIKPDNVMLSGRHALVTDFGVAKAISEATGGSMVTTLGVAVGTPTYMSPEQAAADPHVDHRSDIYSVGVMAYEMLSGRPPFTGSTPQQVLAAHVTEEPDSVAKRRQSIPPMLEQIVMRCLAKRPADRFQTAAELHAALEPLATPSTGITPTQTRPIMATDATSRSGRPRRVAIALGMGVVLGIAGWTASRLLTKGALSIEVGKSRQVTRDPMPEIHVAISPDGREIAYQAGWSSLGSHIEVRDIEGGKPLLLTKDWLGGQRDAAWLPDGRMLTFTNIVTTTDHASGFWKLPRLGGEAMRPDSTDRIAMNFGLQRTSVGSDSFALSDARGTRVVYPASGTLRQIVWSTARARHDGGALAFMAGNADYVSGWTNVAPSAIWVVVHGRPPVRVTDSLSLNAFPAWLPDGSLLYVSNKDGTRDIWVVGLNRDGTPREPTRRRLTTGLGAFSISVASDGRTLAYDRLTVRQNVYALPLPRNGTASIAAAMPVTRGNQTVERFALSRDGKWLVFDSNIDGNQEIYVMPAAGGDARRVTRNTGDDFSPTFSGAGSQITFHSTRDGTREIYVINTDGSGEHRVSTDAEESLNPSFSPDGRRIAWGNGPQLTSKYSLELVERPSVKGDWQRPTRLPIPDGYGPRWSPDGQQLAYDIRRTANIGIGLFSLGGTPKMLVRSSNDLVQPRWPAWAPDGRSLYFYARDANLQVGIYQVPVTGGAPRKIVQFDAPERQWQSSSAPWIENGMVYMVLRELESDIYVLNLVRK